MRKGIDCHGKEWEEYTEYYHPKFDISNQTFGELTALFRVKSNAADRQAAWLCSCSCGNEVVVPASPLRSGHTSSCGCMRYEKMAATHRKPLEPGQKFGRWTILYALPMRSGCKTGTDYMCECECGTRRAVSRQSLAKGSSTSCGCALSLGEQNISQVLKENHIQFNSQQTFSDLVSDTGTSLRYDFAILSEEKQPIRLIEFDGPQHKQSFEYFGGEESFQRLQNHDNLKNQYAFGHNIPLVRIPYKERDNITLDLLLGDKYLLYSPS